VGEVARRDKEARFTALLHQVSLARLRWADWALSPQAAPGVDGVTWHRLQSPVIGLDRIVTSRGNRKPANMEKLPDDVIAPVSCPLRSTNATLPSRPRAAQSPASAERGLQ
jgi:hypothetical protein